jgi:hypothetical protein
MTTIAETCNCPDSKKKIYYSNISLYTRLTDGSLGGSAPPMPSIKHVTVCTECGLAKFMITQEELRLFRVG